MIINKLHAYEEISTSEPQSNCVNILVRSGGIVNLCIGTSFISIMELMLTAIRLPIYEIANIAQACRNAKTADAQKVNNKKIK